MTEKLRILKMIEDGQITAAEAAQLLQALDGGASSAPPPPAKKYEGNSNDSKSHGEPHYGLDDLGQKFESFAREMAPKVEKFAGAVASQIAGVAERVSDAFTPPPEAPATAAAPSGSQHRAAPPKAAKPSAPAGGLEERQIELPVEVGGYNELNLSGLNADIRVKGYNGDKITARLTYQAKKAKAYIELVKLGGKYFLKYEEDEFSSVSIDAFVPERAFGVIKIDGINGQMDASSLSATEMHFSNSNGITNLSALSAANIYAEASNGRFSVSNITAESASFENLNAPLEAIELDIAKLKLSNYNSPLSVIMSKFDRHTSYIWSVETGNEKLSINLPTATNLGYHIKAHAAMGEIRLGLTNLQYLINEPSLVEARSTSFDSLPKKVKIAVETSNASLIIN
ncbi:MAG: DUF4097 domain-containing protein [Defluviitaleaceae bacterium]|nr:DUF4097 domain-containing protein [Defluviitaleaceae bacterium]MCL2263458.1 DUF4097 domain-containing protein [Defluviitaleaceae bacterium]